MGIEPDGRQAAHSEGLMPSGVFKFDAVYGPQFRAAALLMAGGL